MKTEKVVANGVEFPCDVSTFYEDEKNPTIVLKVETDFITAHENFVDNALEVLKYNNKEIDISVYSILTELKDTMNGEIVVSYRKLSDLEQMIQLHYGGVN